MLLQTVLFHQNVICYLLEGIENKKTNAQFLEYFKWRKKQIGVVQIKNYLCQVCAAAHSSIPLE